MQEFIKAALLVVVAEMGDKTQLMTIAIAADTAYPLFILMGTTVGMLIADGIGILGGISYFVMKKSNNEVNADLNSNL